MSRRRPEGGERRKQPEYRKSKVSAVSGHVQKPSQFTEGREEGPRGRRKKEVIRPSTGRRLPILQGMSRDGAERNTVIRRQNYPRNEGCHFSQEGGGGGGKLVARRVKEKG